MRKFCSRPKTKFKKSKLSSQKQSRNLLKWFWIFKQFYWFKLTFILSGNGIFVNPFWLLMDNRFPRIMSSTHWCNKNNSGKSSVRGHSITTWHFLALFWPPTPHHPLMTYLIKHWIVIWIRTKVFFKALSYSQIHFLLFPKALKSVF